MKPQIKYLILLAINCNLFASSCVGDPVKECSMYNSSSSSQTAKDKCKNHHKASISGLGNQCFWQSGGIYGIYCLPSPTICG